ncbi:MAG: amidohydrolase [Candidatus Kryptonium sp.]|nr:amidohydrolase [Candidatus Kryptonium sp.]
MTEKFEIWDAHVHFFSFNFFKTLIKIKGGEARLNDEFAILKERYGIETPPVSPVQLARRWIEEMGKYGISKIVLFASIPEDALSVSTALAAFPDKFIGFFTLNPLSENVDLEIKRAVENMGMKGILLFPALYHIHVNDELLERVYIIAEEYRLVIFTHFGILKMPVREAIGLRDQIDISYANPTDLHRVAIRHPDISFIIPHFGAGYFQELLMLGVQCKNVYVDTSGSNSWIRILPYKIDLKTVFAKTIDIFGVDRIIFGTDSGVFPRGYRVDILNQQLEILNDLGLSDSETQKILSGNLKRLLGFVEEKFDSVKTEQNF